MFNLETAIGRAQERKCGRCNTLETVVIITLNDGRFIYICHACAGIALNQLVRKDGDLKLDELL